MSPAVARRFRRSLAALSALVTLATATACGDTPSASNPLAGTWTATVFKVVPEGTFGELDVKAAGGSVTITIAEDNTTTGQLFIPAALLGSGADFRESMAGSVVANGSSVKFTQSADTFIRDLAWTASGNTISVTNQLLSGDAYTITLTR